MFSSSLIDSHRQQRWIALCANQTRGWAGTRPSDVFHHCPLRDLYYRVATDGGKLDCTHACGALPINASHHRAVWDPKHSHTETRQAQTDSSARNVQRNVRGKLHKNLLDHHFRTTPRFLSTLMSISCQAAADWLPAAWQEACGSYR